MKTTEYNTLVNDAYIKPIRSVVMIDDKFPSYANLLERSDNDPIISASTKKYLKILCSLCEEMRWTFHVEDKFPSSNELYNADLIFLDFKLGDEDDGEIAINAIEKYCNSGRFNFIIVYTEEDIKKVFSKIVVSLGSQEIPVDQSAEDIVFEIDSDHSGFSHKITEIAREHYCEFILNSKVGMKAVFNEIKSELNRIGIKCGKTIHSCAAWAIGQIAKNRSNKNHNAINITGDFVPEYNWLQIGNLFLTVIVKDENFSGNDLLNKIRNAFYAWDPTPGQLIMKDAKNQIDDFCVFDLFQSKRQEIAWFYFTYISHEKFMTEDDILHNLIDLVKDQLKNRLHPNFKNLTLNKTISDFYSDYQPALSGKDDLFHDINIYNSTLNKKKPDHFSTGMILKSLDEQSPSYWICMTQDCDLIPEQNSLKWAPGGTYKPITLVKLHSQKKTTALTNATRGNTVFFEEGKGKKCLCIFEETQGGAQSNPHYETFFAPQKGKFDSPNSIIVYQVDATSSGKLEFAERKFSFITQLRSEYASMLLQKIANHRARIPVNYINLPKEQDSGEQSSTN